MKMRTMKTFKNKNKKKILIINQTLKVIIL